MDEAPPQQDGPRLNIKIIDNSRAVCSEAGYGLKVRIGRRGDGIAQIEGHEEGQVIGTETIPFNDKKAVLQIVAALGGGNG